MAQACPCWPEEDGFRVFFKSWAPITALSGLIDFLYGDRMKTIDEHILKVSKEIVVKFIEVGRISPSNFNDIFKSIYKGIREAVTDAESDESTP